MKKTIIILGILGLFSALLVIGQSCKKEVLLPTINTTTVVDVMGNTATCGGDIIDNGGGDITESGICWSTGGEPTISNSKVINGAVSGVFSSVMTDLDPFTQYFVRAYATNEAGTTYGNTMTFATMNVPIATTNEVTDVSRQMAKSGGTVQQITPASAITKRGVCWSTTSNPTIDDSKTENGSGDGQFSSMITDLQAGTIYYVRAYATDMYGTGYGENMTFTTIAENEFTTVTDIDGNTYETVFIGTQLWMAENLRSTRLTNDQSLTYYSSDYFDEDSYAYKNYENDENNAEEYGYYYTFLVVKSGRICPEGWRIPTEQDFISFESYILSDYGNTTPASSLKSSTGWNALNGDNYYGFNAKPTGHYSEWQSQNSGFDQPGKYFKICSNETYNENVNTFAYCLKLSDSSDDIIGFHDDEGMQVKSWDSNLPYGFTIRCIKE